MPIQIDSPVPAHFQSYTCPSAWTPTGDSNHKNVLGWMSEAVQEGQRYLESQRGYDDIDNAISMIIGEDEKISKALSHVKINLAKRDIAEIVATLSNIRMLGTIKTDNKELDDVVSVLNRAQKQWYLSTFADRKIRSALQFAAVGAKGYVEMGWKKDYWTAGRGDIVLTPRGPRAVLPIQMGPDHDLQECYCVIIKETLGLNRALAKFPNHSDLFMPNGDRPGWFRRAMRKLKFNSPALNASEMDKNREDDGGFPLVDIFKAYIIDLTVNTSTYARTMGKVGTNWEYTVPYLGQEIASDQRNEGGQTLYRKAEWEDCLLYPLRRRVIFTPIGIIEDDSSPWWHRRVPIIPFSLDDWPWDYLGYSLTRDVEKPQQSLTRILRAMDDSANARLDAPIGYDDSGGMSKGAAERFNPRKGGQRLRMNMQMGDPIKMLVPPAYYDLPSWVPELAKSLGESIPSLLGARGMEALGKAKQMPAGDTLEKLMELTGPRTIDRARNEEVSIRDITDMWVPMAFQFYTTKRLLTMLGPDAAISEMKDYDPTNLIPSHTQAEFALIKEGKRPADKSSTQLVHRALHHIENFYTEVKAHSAHSITQMSRRLELFQLFLRGFPIDPETVAEAFDITNFGRISEYAHIFGLGQDAKLDTVLGRYFAWAGIQSAIAQAGGGPQPGQRGRKPSGQTSPSMIGKSGGRQTIRESPR